MPGEEEHFLLNPFGLLYHEVTASSLIKVDLQGRVVHGGSTLFGVNYAGFVLHSAVHAARADARFVLHIHHPPCVAVRNHLHIQMNNGVIIASQPFKTNRLRFKGRGQS